MFNVILSNGDQAMMSKQEDEARLWHLRYGHLNYKSLHMLAAKNMIEGLPIVKEEAEELCEGCAIGKQARSAFPNTQARRQAGNTTC